MEEVELDVDGNVSRNCSAVVRNAAITPSSSTSAPSPKRPFFVVCTNRCRVRALPRSRRRGSSSRFRSSTRSKSTTQPSSWLRVRRCAIFTPNAATASSPTTCSAFRDSHGRLSIFSSSYPAIRPFSLPTAAVMASPTTSGRMRGCSLNVRSSSGDLSGEVAM